MKLEKDRLWAKVESLEANLLQLQDNDKDPFQQHAKFESLEGSKFSPHKTNMS
jgi:hypothetical protein